MEDVREKDEQGPVQDQKPESDIQVAKKGDRTKLPGDDEDYRAAGVTPLPVPKWL